jgi:precorrin-2 dehydrogenase
MVDGRRARVLVVGGGTAAAREAETAGAAGATVHVVAEAPGETVRAVAVRMPTVTVESRAYAPQDVAWATLVFAASDDPALDARVAEHAHAAGRLVSVPGNPAAGTFTSPVALRAGEIVVAVSAEALAPLARSIRDMIGERVGVGYARALEGLMGLRDELLARGQEDRWLNAVESLLDDDACLAIERGTFARRLAAWR